MILRRIIHRPGRRTDDKSRSISNRTGDDDVWLANLNKTGSDRFSDLSQTPQAAESHPVWNADGTQLAWASSASQNVDNNGIYVWDSTQPNLPPKWIGDGDWPAWNSHSDEIVTGVTNAKSTKDHRLYNTG